MKSRPTVYPDISDIIARKAAGRRQLASLSFGEKLDLLDKLREGVAPMQVARETRRGASAVKSNRKAEKK